MHLEYIADQLARMYDKFPDYKTRPKSVVDLMEGLNEEYEIEHQRLARVEMGYAVGVYEEY